jgi:hypothetical protein
MSISQAYGGGYIGGWPPLTRRQNDASSMWMKKIGDYPQLDTRGIKHYTA